MEHVNWQGLVDAVIVFLGVLSTAIGLWNRSHITAIRADQKEVRANLDQIANGGKQAGDNPGGSNPPPENPHNLDVP